MSMIDDERYKRRNLCHMCHMRMASLQCECEDDEQKAIREEKVLSHLSHENGFSPV